jgi:hypothetical protein
MHSTTARAYQAVVIGAAGAVEYAPAGANGLRTVGNSEHRKPHKRWLLLEQQSSNGMPSQQRLRLLRAQAVPSQQQPSNGRAIAATVRQRSRNGRAIAATAEQRPIAAKFDHRPSNGRVIAATAVHRSSNGRTQHPPTHTAPSSASPQLSSIPPALPACPAGQQLTIHTRNASRRQHTTICRRGK